MSLKQDPKHAKSPKKPALVHGEGESVDHKSANRHIIWDEKSIVEHDKLRGTRMKVSVWTARTLTASSLDHNIILTVADGTNADSLVY
jgi:hypothetical protein